MLEVRGQGVVDRARRPAVGIGLHILDLAVASGALDARLQLRSDLAEHRLHGQYHSLAQLHATAAAAVVVDLRVLVHPAPDPVPDEVADDVESPGYPVLLHRRADAADVVPRLHLRNCQDETLVRRPDELPGA